MFNNLNDLMKHMKNNVEDIMEGKIIEYECPHCKEKTKIKILKGSKGECLKCKSKISIEFKVK
ncbi:hypothetical protein [Clostridium tetani]|uniref:hypothetical protein n=1 Tax=Clostridium tetani TaxID=1513 RepID=UPI001009C351|nr:hypothetical protein [Clostridium tetani]